jgi:hypothetical protein
MDMVSRPTHLLVVADIWCQVDGLCDEVRDELEGEGAEVLVTAPPLASRLHTMTSDTDRETALARERLDDILRRLGEHGVKARGLIGAHDPALAIDDALAEFPADKIVVVTDSTGHQNWREQRLPAYLESLDLPVAHFLVAHEIAE